MPLEGLIQRMEIPSGHLQRPTHRFRVQRPPEASACREFPVRPGDSGVGYPVGTRPVPAVQETGELDAEDLPSRLATDLNLAAASTIDEAGLVLKEFLLDAPRGVPGFPGERSGPGLLQFRRSFASSASELLAISVIAFRRQARLTWQSWQPQSAAWVSSCRAISISKKALSLPAA